MQTRRASIQVRIAIAWSSEDDCFIAWSPELGCVRDGATQEEAVEMCKEAIEVRFESWIERGTLEENLLASGYKKRGRDRPARITNWHNETPIHDLPAPSPHLVGLIKQAQEKSVTIRPGGQEARVG